MKNAWNSNCSSSNCFDPNSSTRTKLSAGFTATLFGTSSLCEGRLHSHILQFPQTLVLLAVLFLTTKNGSKDLLSLCQVFVVQSLAMVVELILYSVCRISNSLWFSCDVWMILQGNSAMWHCVLLGPSNIWQRLSVFVVIMSSCKYGYMASVLFLTSFLQHLFSLVVHSLAFRSSIFGTATAILLNNIAKDWGDVVVVFSNSSGLCEDFKFLPQLQNTMPSSQWYCNRGIAFWNSFRKARRSGCCSFRRSIPAILSWTCWSSASGSSPEGRIPCAGGSRTSRSTFRPRFHVLYPAVRLSKGVCQEFCSQRRCSKFRCNSSIRWVGHKMILRLGLVDLVDRCAKSLWVQPVAILELSVLLYIM